MSRAGAKRAELKAPFPWFGGKRRVAHLVWERFGDVYNYVEPFFGSGAVMLLRPHAPRCETINDVDCFVANFWRATAREPKAVAAWADWPVNEADLHARHQWLVDNEEFAERMKTDPDYYDAKVAGWWVWGISMWIGSGWCKDLDRQRPHLGAQGVTRKLVDLRRSGHGVLRKTVGEDEDLEAKVVARKRVNLPQGHGRGVLGVTRQVPDISGDSGAYGRGVHSCGLPGLECYFEALAARLRRTRVCCGDWNRVLGPSPTYKIGLTGVLLDPPYAGKTGRCKSIYRKENLKISKKVRDWAVENGSNRLMRIALCGLEGEHDMPGDWECVSWKANGGYGNQGDGAAQARAKTERIWFSPHCLKKAQSEIWDLKKGTELPTFNPEVSGQAPQLSTFNEQI